MSFPERWRACLGKWHLRPPRRQREPIFCSPRPGARTMLITGATGLIGRHLCRRLIGRGERVIVLTRSRARAEDLYGSQVRVVTSLADIAAEESIDVLINLAGAPILAARWTRARRRELLESRVRVTRDLAALSGRLQRRPELLISASGAGYYGVRGAEEVTEVHRGQPIFQSHLCQNWELAAQATAMHGVRVCCLRLGVVLAADGGMLPQLLRAARARIQLTLGSGEQWLSWIHIGDVLDLIDWCIKDGSLRGGINATAPEPLRQRELAQLLAQFHGRSLRLRVPGAPLRALLGEMSQLLIAGQRVFPAKALCAGFTFRYHSMPAALEQLLSEHETRIPRRRERAGAMAVKPLR